MGARWAWHAICQDGHEISGFSGGSDGICDYYGNGKCGKSIVTECECEETPCPNIKKARRRLAGPRILTREMYEVAIMLYQGKQRKRLLARWDAAAEKYGPCDLDKRNWGDELLAEEDDAVAYKIIKGVAEE